MRSRAKQGNRRCFRRVKDKYGHVVAILPIATPRHDREAYVRPPEVSLTNWQTSQWQRACRGLSPERWPPRSKFAAFKRGVDLIAVVGNETLTVKRAPQS